eukprot:9475730-Pyramimonas_sp.AAC.2
MSKVCQQTCTVCTSSASAATRCRMLTRVCACLVTVLEGVASCIWCKTAWAEKVGTLGCYWTGDDPQRT